ncbi:MAG TPA: hypothetical protein PLC44_08985 [Saprospiraceae bacterium]|nr:hypothetical protein [Saprospiraceae bacterium]HNO18663.1 hypothetical protein [Saprospiraceae bacterium]
MGSDIQQKEVCLESITSVRLRKPERPYSNEIPIECGVWDFWCVHFSNQYMGTVHRMDKSFHNPGEVERYSGWHHIGRTLVIRFLLNHLYALRVFSNCPDGKFLGTPLIY